AVLGLPRPKDPIGSAEARARVHDRGAADAFAEGQGDRRTAERQGGPAAAVQTLDALHRRSVEIVLREVRAFLEDDDAKPRARELVRHDGAARARADDADVGRLLDRTVDVGMLERREALSAARRHWLEAVVGVAERRFH